MCITSSFFYLCLQTVFLWGLVIFLHRKKGSFTLIPLYVFIGALALLTHNLSDLGFAVVAYGQYFLVASFSFFTSMMLGVFFLYLFEGVRATRLALTIILGVSFLYIAVVLLLNYQVDATHWVYFDGERLRYYFWSVAAIVLDVFFLAMVWELLGKLRILPLSVRVFSAIFATFSLDSLVFVSGVFGGQGVYGSILGGSLSVRFILACMITPIIVFYLKRELYVEVSAERPRKFWEILDLHSDLENQIKTMEEVLQHEKELERDLDEAREQYALALEGANAGIWDWDIKRNRILYSDRFCALVGFAKEDLGTTIEQFKKILHPDDNAKTFALLNECFKKKTAFSIEYRLKTKEEYRWFLCGGVVKFSDAGKPLRMVGSIIDIHEKKLLIESYAEKVDELEKMNKIMVDRELRMVELKKELRGQGTID